MEINYFDLVSASIILLLGLKGIINGFFKEVFGLVGIIGGIFIASRFGDTFGKYLNELIFNFTSDAAANFVGFLAALALFWLLMVIVGYLFKKLSAMSGLGPVDKILGFVFGASKFFLIASVIAHAAYSINAVKTNIDSALSNSIVFPIMAATGSYIMKIDPVEMKEELNATMTDVQESIEEKSKDIIEDAALEKIEEIKAEIQEVKE